MHSLESPNIAIICGGTGGAAVLSELKYFTPNITAAVNMADDDGSSGKLVRKYGVMPPGDVNQCQTALSNNEGLARSLRIRDDDGHTPGNLWLAELELKLGSFETAVDIVNRELDITGRVLPVTLLPHVLALRDGNEEVFGESKIGHRQFISKTPTVRLEPNVPLNPRVEAALYAADQIVIAPGNRYGSLLPALVVRGMKETLRDCDAQLVMISNLLYKKAGFSGGHVVDDIHTIERHIGEGIINVTLYNTNLPSADMIARYGNPGETAVDISPERFNEVSARAIGALLLSRTITESDLNDTLIRHRRTQIKHDGREVARQLMQIASSPKLMKVV
ncbi:MAG: gluconeogenesis factor YvcK family protein [Candidatus Saccharimonadales bacterium]